MKRSFPALALLLCAAAVLAPRAGAQDGGPDLLYADALYYAHQGEWFEATVRLDAEQAAPRPTRALRSVMREGRPLAFFELNYRMHRRAGRAMEALIESAKDDAVRNEALFRLARLYFQKDQPADAMRSLERMRGDVPPGIRADVAFLRANIALAAGRTVEAARILKGLRSENGLEGFSAYNLGIALLLSGREEEGRAALDRAGRIGNDDRASLAIRDKANLVLGEKLMSDGRFDAAKAALDRVRLAGPFSNRALLSSGWADASQNRFESALAPWSALAGREVTDPAVQEALLAVPYAYARLGVYGTAAKKYEAALDAFVREIGKLDASIASVRQGHFLASLLREEPKQDAAWLARLRELPQTPETFYLLELMASHDFQESLRNYLDLEELRGKLETWSRDLAAFEDLITRRQKHYLPLLPDIDRELRRLEAEMGLRTMRRDRIAKQLDAMRASPDPERLITADERGMDLLVARLEKFAARASSTAAGPFRERVRRLRAALYWNMYAQYDQRFADAQAHLAGLDRELETLRRRRQDILRARQTAVGGYQGYADLISRQRRKIADAAEKVRQLIPRQAQVLETMAVNELTRRRGRLEEFRVKAKYALADSYDRATSRARTKDAQ